MSKDPAAKLLDGINTLEKDLGLSNQFFYRLLGEDDWSFIIKLHSLFEAAVTHLLTKELKREEIENNISELELSNKKSGKLAFARSLRLLSKEEARYIYSLSELRNMLVHNISNVNFNIENYKNSLNKQKLESFSKSFGFALKEEFIMHTRKYSRDKFIKENPKMTIWMSALSCLETVYQKKMTAELDAKFNDTIGSLLEIYLKGKSNNALL